MGEMAKIQDHHFKKYGEIGFEGGIMYQYLYELLLMKHALWVNLFIKTTHFPNRPPYFKNI